MERRQEQVLRGQAASGLTRLPGRDLDEPPGVRGVGELLSRASGPPPATAGLEPLPDLYRIEPQPGESGYGGPVFPQQAEQNVLGADGLMSQALGLGPGVLQGSLGTGAQRMGVQPGRRLSAQSGLASSINMMGMPSSTGYTRRQA